MIKLLSVIALYFSAEAFNCVHCKLIMDRFGNRKLHIVLECTVDPHYNNLINPNWCIVGFDVSNDNNNCHCRPFHYCFRLGITEHLPNLIISSSSGKLPKIFINIYEEN